MRLEHRKKFSELHDLIYVENVLFERAADRRIEHRQLLQPRLIDIGGCELRKLALKINVIRNLLRGFAQLVHQQDAEGNLP